MRLIRMRRLGWALTIVSLALAYSTQASEAPTAPAALNCKSYAYVTSPEEQAQVDTMVMRCTPGDQCMLACKATGCGDAIMGGCGHLCFAYLDRFKDPNAVLLKKARRFLDAASIGQCPYQIE